jgi:hypothetical protein
MPLPAVKVGLGEEENKEVMELARNADASTIGKKFIRLRDEWKS